MVKQDIEKKDVPASSSSPPVTTEPKACYVRRRLKSGSYSEEFSYLVSQWFDWHYYPINVKHYADVFPDHQRAQSYIQKQKKSWPNFEYEILNLDS